MKVFSASNAWRENFARMRSVALIHLSGFDVFAVTPQG
jgi:hypothetical protein